jgi:hypothetical protein
VWGKIDKRRCFRYFGGGRLETPTWDRGWGCNPQCIPDFTVFGAHVLGFYYTFGGNELARSESEWIILSIGFFCTHHLVESGDRARLLSTSAVPYLPTG